MRKHLLIMLVLLIGMWTITNHALAENPNKSPFNDKTYFWQNDNNQKGGCYGCWEGKIFSDTNYQLRHYGQKDHIYREHQLIKWGGMKKRDIRLRWHNTIGVSSTTFHVFANKYLDAGKGWYINGKKVSEVEDIMVWNPFILKSKKNRPVADKIKIYVDKNDYYIIKRIVVDWRSNKKLRDGKTLYEYVRTMINTDYTLDGGYVDEIKEYNKDGIKTLVYKFPNKPNPVEFAHIRKRNDPNYNRGKNPIARGEKIVSFRRPKHFKELKRDKYIPDYQRKQDNIEIVYRAGFWVTTLRLSADKSSFMYSIQWYDAGTKFIDPHEKQKSLTEKAWDLLLKKE